MVDELRKSLRFEAKEGSFAAFFPPDENNCLMLGRIMDISEGGLGICYLNI